MYLHNTWNVLYSRKGGIQMKLEYTKQHHHLLYHTCLHDRFRMGENLKVKDDTREFIHIEDTHFNKQAMMFVELKHWQESSTMKILYFSNIRNVFTKIEWSSGFLSLPKCRYRHKDYTEIFVSLIRFFSNHLTLHRSDLIGRATPLNPRLYPLN